MTTEKRTLDALREMAHIVDKADGRPMTRTQSDDFQAALAIVDDGIGNGPTGNSYTDELVKRMRTATSDEAKGYMARELAERLPKVSAANQFDQLQAAMSPRIERTPLRATSWTDSDSIRALWREVRTHGFAAMDIDRSEMFRGGDEYRALQSAGGSAYPTNFADFVTVYERTSTPMLNPQVVTVLDRPNGQPLTLPRLTSDPNHGGSVTAEAAGINELDATISSVQLDAYKYGVISLWSAELDQDEALGLEDLIASSISRELSLDIGAAFTTGSGSGTPNGFITAATNGGTASGTATGSATDAFFSPSDLVDFYMTLPGPIRANGVWQVSTTAMAKIMKFKDSNKQFVVQPGLTGQPATFLGRPILENPAMAAVASASKSIAFGDFRRYVVKRAALRVELSRDYKFSTDQVALKVVERVDGDLIDTAAIAYLVSGNS